MAYENLKAAIKQAIKQNGNQEITGNLLQSTLLNIVNTLGADYKFLGFAMPSTVPPTSEEGRLFYFASEAGEYINFPTTGENTWITIGEGLYMFTKEANSNYWKEETLIEITQELEAKKVVYNNETSGLKAGNVQEAIDETNTKVSDLSFDNIKRVSPLTEFTINEEELLDGYIPQTGGTAVVYKDYKHTKSIHLKKGECISAYLYGNSVTLVASTNDDINYIPIISIGNIKRDNNLIYFVAKEDIQVSLCSSSKISTYTIYSANNIIEKINSQRALLIPYKTGIINLDTHNKLLTFPANWIVSYVQNNGKLKNKYFDVDKEVSFANLQNQMVVLYNTNTESIEIVDYTNSINNNAFILFELVRNDNSFIVNLPIELYSINGRQTIKEINDFITSFKDVTNTRLLNIETNIAKEIPNKIELDWIEGYYIDKNGGVPIQYDSYEITHPIKAIKGQKVKINLKGDAVSGVSSTTLDENSSMEEITSYNYKSLYSLRGTDVQSITLVIEKDCYLVFCRRTSNLDPNCQLINLEFFNSEKIENNLEALKKELVIPSFVMEETKKTFKRFEKWKGTDNCCVFPIMTDLHPNLDDRPYSYITYMIESDKLFGYNFIANLGDFGDHNTYDANGNVVSNLSDKADMSKTEEIDYSIIVKAAEKFGKWKGRLMFSQGNHDCVDNSLFASKTFGRESVWNYLMMPTINRFPSEFNVNNKHQCGYYDDKDNKIRIIFLNTSDNQKEDYDNGESNKQYKVSKEQLEWLVQTLGSVSKGYGVIILAHFCINRIGEWKSYPQTNINQDKWAASGPQYEQGLGRILEGFANKTSGTDNESSNKYYNSNVSWDFSSVDDTCKLIAYICGDSHFDALLKKDDIFVTENGKGQIPAGISCPANGVNYLISQGYGKVPESECHSKARYTKFNHDATEQMLCDVVAVKTEKRIVKVFRIGAGGESCDREFFY